jgi:hypothetical protein
MVADVPVGVDVRQQGKSAPKANDDAQQREGNGFVAEIGQRGVERCKWWSMPAFEGVGGSRGKEDVWSGCSIRRVEMFEGDASGPLSVT